MADLSAFYPNTTDRLINRLVRDIAQTNGLGVHEFGQGWLIRLTRGERVRHIHGFTFDINNAAAHMLATDKAGTADVLALCGIPHVPHRVFLHPRLGPFVPHGGDWERLAAWFKEWGGDVVLKDNNGTGGYDVYRARSMREVEAAAYRILQRCTGLSICPFVEIEREVRVVLLDGHAELCYEKLRPRVVGDGVRTVSELAVDALRSGGVSPSDLSELGPIARVTPAPGVAVPLRWKHNLGQGARPRRLDPAEIEAGPLAGCIRLAAHAAGAIGLRFGSVDLVVVDGQPRVLEVNSGVMLEAFAHASPENMSIARGIYARAIGRMFAGEEGQPTRADA